VRNFLISIVSAVRNCITMSGNCFSFSQISWLRPWTTLWDFPWAQMKIPGTWAAFLSSITSPMLIALVSSLQGRYPHSVYHSLYSKLCSHVTLLQINPPLHQHLPTLLLFHYAWVRNLQSPFQLSQQTSHSYVAS